MYDFDEKESLSNYTGNRANLEYSHEPMLKSVLKESDGGIEYSRGTDDTDKKNGGGDMRNNRSVRNEEIRNSEIKNDVSSKNPIVLSAMLWVSNSVTVIFFSMFIFIKSTRFCKALSSTPQPHILLGNPFALINVSQLNLIIPPNVLQPDPAVKIPIIVLFVEGIFVYISLTQFSLGTISISCVK